MDDQQNLQVTTSALGNLIRITFKQWVHVTENHDYMSGNLDKVLETLSQPDKVLRGERGEALALRAYASTNITRKTSVVIYREEPKGFMITAFFTSKPEKVEKSLEVLWLRSQPTSSENSSP